MNNPFMSEALFVCFSSNVSTCLSDEQIELYEQGLDLSSTYTKSQLRTINILVKSGRTDEFSL
jgi:hypothetical protein